MLPALQTAAGLQQAPLHKTHILPVADDDMVQHLDPHEFSCLAHAAGEGAFDLLQKPDRTLLTFLHNYYFKLLNQ